MENNTIEMELNNEEVMENDVIETENDEISDAEADTSIETEDEGNPIGALLAVLALGGAAVGLMLLARRKELKEKRYERLKRKMEKEAAKRGEIVTFDVEEVYEEVAEPEEVDSEEEIEN